MHKKLLDYWQKFFDKNQHQSQLEKFYTQHDNRLFWQQIPYIPNIESFCLRLYQAQLKNQKICVYSDYDTDAVTATATMVKGLEILGFNSNQISFYAPDRFTEGYGLNPEAISKLCLENDLIISVDCGINSVLEAQNTLKTNCDLIITDHHHLTGQIPKALAVVNPRLTQVYQQNPNLVQNWKLDQLVQETNIYFVKNWKLEANHFLSESVTGVGVAWFCLVWYSYFLLNLGSQTQTSALKIKSSVKPKLLNQLLPFVAIGTIADCQSVLEPTNRHLVKAGLQTLQTQKFPTLGLAELMAQTSLTPKLDQGYLLTSQDLAFTLSPILNASGRINHASLSISTILANDPLSASTLASQLINTNQERKQQVKNILTEIETEAKTQVNNGQKVIWLQGYWNKGLVGLIASRLVNQHNLPCIVISIENTPSQTLATASLRAPENYHLPEAMTQVEQKNQQIEQGIFIKFGGHPGASGFTAKNENLEIIKAGLIQTLENQLQTKITKQNQFQPNNSLPYNDTIPKNILSTLNQQKNLIYFNPTELVELPQILSQIWNLDPFGQDFPIPLFAFILKTYTSKKIGKTQDNHLKINFETSANQTLNLTFFNLENDQVQQILSLTPSNISPTISPINKPKLLILAKASQNTWNGATTDELIGEKIYILD
jgi:single-stranded DNA-specific DHH superfamily exonuclease